MYTWAWIWAVQLFDLSKLLSAGKALRSICPTSNCSVVVDSMTCSLMEWQTWHRRQNPASLSVELALFACFVCERVYLSLFEVEATFSVSQSKLSWCNSLSAAVVVRCLSACVRECVCLWGIVIKEEVLWSG